MRGTPWQNWMSKGLVCQSSHKSRHTITPQTHTYMYTHYTNAFECYSVLDNRVNYTKPIFTINKRASNAFVAQQICVARGQFLPIRLMMADELLHHQLRVYGTSTLIYKHIAGRTGRTNSPMIPTQGYQAKWPPPPPPPPSPLPPPAIPLSPADQFSFSCPFATDRPFISSVSLDARTSWRLPQTPISFLNVHLTGP